MEDKLLQIKSWLGTGSINIFGIQFSGKDTVGKRLADAIGAEFLSSGDVMRATFANKELAANEEIWQAAKTGSLNGSYMPTREFADMITQRLSQSDLIGKSLILSTVGRWIGEEVPVLEALQKGAHDTKAVLVLNISEEESWRRWKLAGNSRNGGRDDDISEEKVARRIGEFKTKTLPVIEVYRQMGILLEIDGEQDRDKVFFDVIDMLDKFSKTSQ